MTSLTEKLRRPMQSRLCTICYGYHLHKRLNVCAGEIAAPLSHPTSCWIQRWKSQRIKTHKLACTFSIDFYIHTLQCGFFCVEITKIWRKSRDFWFTDFFLKIFLIHRLVWIFLWSFSCFKSVSSMFRSNLLLILNFTYYVLSKKTFRSIFVKYEGVLFVKNIHRLGPMYL